MAKTFPNLMKTFTVAETTDPRKKPHAQEI